ncbi:hypothetical protein BDK51DRAFT_25726 [Blyttiomyces helicus]|uniref:Poly(A) RNA polymerase mitochondrial-like central palm domain-containing protein n=1 Tax=Blyttiomyces helicus TaxID=388810 RepID=A0A4P9WQD4_9FUNG|nr:hypothetical protein BDK51DRAFT_25726 [Blyttiomyces helicus]|eukprot:RKO94018.1 hypothetical protein BDK51DRAFT_25726 [Blyttiomyces helicus]
MAAEPAAAPLPDRRAAPPTLGEDDQPSDNLAGGEARPTTPLGRDAGSAELSPPPGCTGAEEGNFDNAKGLPMEAISNSRWKKRGGKRGGKNRKNRKKREAEKHEAEVELYGFRHERVNAPASLHATSGVPPWVRNSPYPFQTIEERLTAEINDYVRFFSSTNADREMRDRVFAIYRKSVASSRPSLSLTLFGSSSTGLYLPGADLDMGIRDDSQPLSADLDMGIRDDSQPLNPEKALLLTKQLNKFAKDIRRNASALVVLTRATVPIIKLTDRDSQLQVDISHRQLGGTEADKYVCEKSASNETQGRGEGGDGGPSPKRMRMETQSRGGDGISGREEDRAHTRDGGRSARAGDGSGYGKRGGGDDGSRWDEEDSSRSNRDSENENVSSSRNSLNPTTTMRGSREAHAYGRGGDRGSGREDDGGRSACGGGVSRYGKRGRGYDGGSREEEEYRYGDVTSSIRDSENVSSSRDSIKRLRKGADSWDDPDSGRPARTQPGSINPRPNPTTAVHSSGDIEDRLSSHKSDDH